MVMRCAKNGGDGEKEDGKKRCQGRERSGHCGFLLSLSLLLFGCLDDREEKRVLMEKKCVVETLKSREDEEERARGYL